MVCKLVPALALFENGDFSSYCNINTNAALKAITIQHVAHGQRQGAYINHAGAS